MAFQAASGYGNLPNGAWSPVIYSKKAQLAFRNSSTAMDICNTDYINEISNVGDSVQIVKEPFIQISEYARGKQMQNQDIIDEDYTLVVDKAHAYQFVVDDIERKQSHINWMTLATDSAGYSLRDAFDKDVLAYIAGFKPSAIGLVGNTAMVAADVPGTPALDSASTASELLASNVLNKGSFGAITTASAGDHSVPIAPRLPGATSVATATVSPFDILARMATRMSVQNVPTQGRWVVISPAFKELMMEERSVMFMNGEEVPRNMLVAQNIHGFRVYESNNLPSIGTGPSTTGSANQNANFGVIVAGHDSSVACAENLKVSETLRSQQTFGDITRGLHVFGRKKLRPEAIVTCKYNVA